LIIFFDAPFESTIDQKGVKQVNIKTSGYEKERISVILACAANGIKLAPVIIFKGQEGKRIEKELSAHNLVQKKEYMSNVNLIACVLPTFLNIG